MEAAIVGDGVAAVVGVGVAAVVGVGAVVGVDVGSAPAQAATESAVNTRTMTPMGRMRMGQL